MGTFSIGRNIGLPCVIAKLHDGRRACGLLESSLNCLTKTVGICHSFGRVRVVNFGKRGAKAIESRIKICLIERPNAGAGAIAEWTNQKPRKSLALFRAPALIFAPRKSFQCIRKQPLEACTIVR